MIKTVDQRIKIDHLRDAMSVQAKNHLDHIEVLDAVNSTNTRLLDKIDSVSKGALCIAQHQTAGRGRQGRPFFGNGGGALMASLAWWFDSLPSDLPTLSLVVGWGIHSALNALGFTDIEVKWPNDLLWCQKKLAGVLVETVTRGARVYCVIGFFINRHVTPEMRASVDQPMTDLLEIGSTDVNVNQLASTVVNQLVSCLLDYEKAGFSLFKARWEKVHRLQHHVVSVTDAQGNVSIGQVMGVNEEGQLCVEMASGMAFFSDSEVKVREKK